MCSRKMLGVSVIYLPGLAVIGAFMRLIPCNLLLFLMLFQVISSPVQIYLTMTYNQRTNKMIITEKNKTRSKSAAIMWSPCALSVLGSFPTKVSANNNNVMTQHSDHRQHAIIFEHYWHLKLRGLGLELSNIILRRCLCSRMITASIGQFSTHVLPPF